MNKRLVAAAFAVALPSLASAQEITLPPIVVTASRTAQTVDETLAPVTVITRDDIERRQAQSVKDVLRGQPGISFSSNGGLGKQSSMLLRGTKTDHVLVLVDGIKAGSATAGGFAWQDIPPDQIERIEIVRGPRSSLYGSEAIGGVVQIFTRKGATGFTPSASVGFGSDDTHQAMVNLAAGSARGWFNIGASHLETGGYDVCDNVTDPNAGCGVNEPDDDGYRRTAGSARAGIRFRGGEAELNFLQSEGRNEYDGSWTNRSDILQRVVGGQLRLSPARHWDTHLIIGRSWDESDDLHDDVHRSTFNTTRDTVSWLNDVMISDRHTVSLGADYQRDEVDSTTDYDRTSRDNVGVFARYFGEYGKHDVELAARHDDNEQYGDHTTGSAAWGYDIGTSLRLLASYGTAFKAPTFNHLYWPADPVFGGGGNPDLEPERSNTIDVGIQGRALGGRWSVHAFQTDIEDLIASGPPDYVPYNVDQARIRGLELAAGMRLLSWDASAALTLLDPENRSEGSRGETLPLRPRRSVRLDLDRAFGALRLGATFLAESSRLDPNSRTGELDGYGILDLRAGYAIAKDWRVQAEIGNLFDKDYETAGYYNQPGRTWFVSLHYAPSAK